MQFKQVQLVVGVPESHLDAVLDALADSGAGVLGDYTHCSFTMPGTGRFKPGPNAHPAVGENNTLNTVTEMRVETLCDYDKVPAVLKAVRAAHPYEEPMIYIFPVLTLEEFEEEGKV